VLAQVVDRLVEKLMHEGTVTVLSISPPAADVEKAGKAESKPLVLLVLPGVESHSISVRVAIAKDVERRLTSKSKQGLTASKIARDIDVVSLFEADESAPSNRKRKAVKAEGPPVLANVGDDTGAAAAAGAAAGAPPEPKKRRRRRRRLPPASTPADGAGPAELKPGGAEQRTLSGVASPFGSVSSVGSAPMLEGEADHPYIVEQVRAALVRPKCCASDPLPGTHWWDTIATGPIDCLFRHCRWSTRACGFGHLGTTRM
jgi:hypothetical protein